MLEYACAVFSMVGAQLLNPFARWESMSVNARRNRFRKERPTIRRCSMSFLPLLEACLRGGEGNVGVAVSQL